MHDVPATTSPAPPSRPIWQRPVSRRAVLATGATGATAAALSLHRKGNDLSQILDHVRDLTHGYQGALSSERVRVAHLLRRSGFGATKAERDHFAAMGQTAATEAILNYSKTSNAALESQLPTVDLGGTPQPTAAAIQAWWLQRMAQSARPLEEKMTLFWHGLLTSGLDKAGPAQLFTQHQLFRGMALGNFDDLLKAVSKDPAMMVYLDTETNRKGKPNENYARELMELFTTGIGHYSEDDVRESARAFTGWTLGRGKQRDALTSTFVARYHDDGVKTFMGKTGTFTGDDIVDMLVPLRATAERLTTRLFSYFAYPNPEPEIVQHLADVFQKNGYNVGAVVKEILTMDAFYSPKAYRALVKSPTEYVAQTLRAVGATSVSAPAVAATGQMGQVLFYPPNVAGWPAGASWINSSTLLTRINFAAGVAQNAAPASTFKGLPGLIDTFIDGNVTPSTRDALTQAATGTGQIPVTLMYFVLATPEYQLN